MKLFQAFSKWMNIRRHISARVFISVFISLFSVSALLIGAYSFSIINETTNAVTEQGQNSMNAVAGQMNTIVNAVAQTHALLYSSESIYEYLNKSSTDMPSYEWFQTYNSAQQTLRLLVRGQANLIMGMMLYKGPQEYMQFGSFYAVLNPYVLKSTNLSGLQVYNGSAYFISTFTMNNGRKMYIVSQLDNRLFDDISKELLAKNNTILIMGSGGIIFRDYTSGKQNTAPILNALNHDQQTHGLLENKWHLVSATSNDAGLTFFMIFPVVTLSEKLIEASSWFTPTLLSSFLAALVLSYGISKRLASGFRTMQENMSRVERKEYDQIELIPSQDEFGQLSLAFNHMATHISTLIRENQERERKEHELEIQVLRAQVSPHFLYNALNNLRHLAQLQGMTHIARMTTALIQLLRAALDNEGLLIPLSQELKYIENYYEICRYQYLDDFMLDIDVSDNLKNFLTPQMILQPIIENAIIHGISKNPGKGIIRLSAKISGEDLLLTVTDNGQGISEDALQELLTTKQNKSKMRFSGIGIHNVNERIRIRFGDSYGLRIQSHLGEYTQVNILLPCVRKEEAN